MTSTSLCNAPVHREPSAYPEGGAQVNDRNEWSVRPANREGITPVRDVACTRRAGIKVSLINSGIIDTDFGGASEGSRDESWSLRPAWLAGLILQLIDQPDSVVVDELTVHPLGQDF
ncbi:MAG: hypothetical protein U1F26_11455 [Lysobacterales bacterium]